MINQPPEPTGQDLRAQGISDVIAADGSILRDARGAIEAALDELIATGGPFTADDLWPRLPRGVEPHHPSLVSAVFAGASSAHRIRAVGYRNSARRSRHASVVRVWVGADEAERAA